VHELGAKDIVVSSSGMATGKAENFISREKISTWTTNTPYAW
jgi:hypothetical protein